MEALFAVFILVANGVIGWLNCRGVGAVWHEAKTTGGLMWVLCWCAAIQSAVGFSSILIVALAMVAAVGGFLPSEYISAAMSLWYLLVIVPALGSGLLIAFHSLVVAWRERSIASMGTAAWNAIAMGHNLYSAASSIPSAWGEVGKLFDSKDSDTHPFALFAVLLVLFAILGGVALTWLLIRKYSLRAMAEARHARRQGVVLA